ncbi:MAG: MAPEG family protein [Enterobacterales bacterium]|nr:MAPEG family protein [Enterobacterales bacterium]
MPILSLYSGLLAVILIILSMKVAMARKKNSVGIGDGGNQELSRAIRVQGNFIEYVPIALILLAVFETNGGNSIVAHVAGGSLLIGRLLHAYGLGKSAGISIGRGLGMLLTWLTILALGLVNIYYFISAFI